ncbi:hypothetical protein QOT40_09965 [Pseudomonas aeruginosa]|uniref:hypothetical protein n=1 Tax=Pseudomonas aeruginosa TaxID=287 RepID=UPI001140FD84|nr:hypothetical protein [Pseudomonas aeruginosa]HBO4377780.1 hypothetical protein [Pseudomonas aeruginosa]HCR1444121.1 hypothetical protein [Pseudomonas aeruginosa]
MEEKKPGILDRLTSGESFAIAALPFIGTCVSFVFESLYLKYYDAPVSLIQMDITRIVSANIIIGFLSIGVVFGIFTTIKVIVKSKNPIRRALFAPLFYMAFFGIAIYISPIPYKAYLFWGAFAFFMLSQFGWPVFTGDKSKSYLERLSKQNEIESSSNDEPPKLTLPLVLSAAFYAVLLIGGLSTKYAEGKAYYFIDPSDEARFLIEIYGDTAIFGRYDPKTRELKEGVEIRKVGDETTRLVYKNIGPIVNVRQQMDFLSYLKLARENKMKEATTDKLEASAGKAPSLWPFSVEANN